mgnify:CR=1 FL=1
MVAANQGASLKHYPPYSWPGGSQGDRSRWAHSWHKPAPTRESDRGRASRYLRPAARERDIRRGYQYMLAHLRNRSSTSVYAAHRATRTKEIQLTDTPPGNFAMKQPIARSMSQRFSLGADLICKQSRENRQTRRYLAVLVAVLCWLLLVAGVPPSPATTPALVSLTGPAKLEPPLSKSRSAPAARINNTYFR